MYSSLHIEINVMHMQIFYTSVRDKVEDYSSTDLGFSSAYLGT